MANQSNPAINVLMYQIRAVRTAILAVDLCLAFGGHQPDVDDFFRDVKRRHQGTIELLETKIRYLYCKGPLAEDPTFKAHDNRSVSPYPPGFRFSRPDEKVLERGHA